jgi:hypothetical protein
MHEKLKTLEEVVAWMHARGLPLVEIVTQDEYTHDVVVAAEPPGYLVFDTTCLGAVTAVAVWDHRPSADELLDARLGRGWQPTATATRDGPQILGYAQCRAVQNK